MTTTGRRIAGMATAGALLLATAGLLVAPVATVDLTTLALSAVVAVGVVQVVVGLGIVVTDGHGSSVVVDRSAWGTGWVLDGVRAIGLAVAVWALFTPSAHSSAAVGWLALGAVLAAAPFSRRLDRRALPTLAPGTYSVSRQQPTATTVAPLRLVHSVRVVDLRDDARPRIDTRL